MEKAKIKQALQALKEQEAWAQISRNARLSPRTIERYCEQIDWAELSDNEEIRWNVQLVEKFKERIDFSSLSRSLFSRCRNNDEKKLEWVEHLEIVRSMPQMLDWKVLSQSYLPSRREFFKEFSDYWNWEEVADNRNIEWTDALFEEYEDKLLPALLKVVLDNIENDAERVELFTTLNNGISRAMQTACKQRRMLHRFHVNNLWEKLVEKETGDLISRLLKDADKSDEGLAEFAFDKIKEQAKNLQL